MSESGQSWPCDTVGLMEHSAWSCQVRLGFKGLIGFIRLEGLGVHGLGFKV